MPRTVIPGHNLADPAAQVYLNEGSLDCVPDHAGICPPACDLTCA